MKFEPFADRVLIEPKKAEEKTAAGLFLPDSVREKPQQGTVVAVAKGMNGVEMISKVGDIVLYGKFSGNELEFDGNKYLMMRENELFGRIA